MKEGRFMKEIYSMEKGRVDRSRILGMCGPDSAFRHGSSVGSNTFQMGMFLCSFSYLLVFVCGYVSVMISLAGMEICMNLKKRKYVLMHRFKKCQDLETLSF